MVRVVSLKYATKGLLSRYRRSHGASHRKGFTTSLPISYPESTVRTDLNMEISLESLAIHPNIWTYIIKDIRIPKRT